MRTVATLLFSLAFASVAHAQAYESPPRARGPVPENVNFGYADVLRVDPVYEYYQVAEPREECYEERVVTREPRGGDTTGGTILGALIGGAIGNQVGSGDGRRAATVAGAVIGGSVGRNVDRSNSPGRTYEDRGTRCRLVEDARDEQRISAYNVEYRYRGEVYMSQLAYDPGDRLRVRVSVTPAE
ncbi:MAG TPA: glycine zipper 2TM domain-containing protein [Candidatus Saccharimonadia bacterium]|nr:glycine zipper 2TM domain-containing protein [Candidatus Saccharimonadia bacterium]